MRCEEAASALVDDRARRSEELNAHVASCEACRGVLALDAFARELVRFDPVPLIRAPDLTAEVTRRMRIRFAFVTVGILGVGLAGAVWTTRPNSGAGTPEPMTEIREVPEDWAAPAGGASET